MKKFNLISKFPGYANKQDITNIDVGFMVPPSQNVFINDGEKVAIRNGYTLYGQASTDAYPIKSAYDWLTSTGAERNIRALNDELQYRYVASNGTVTWRTLIDSLTFDEVNFTEWWSSTEVQDLLLFAIGDSSIRMWSGAVTTIASVGTNTLTKEGSTTWAEERFLQNGTRTVVINGVTYTYTGGEGTTTLTGVTPDPALASPAIAAGDIAHQGVRTTANTPASGFNVSLLEVSKNQVYYGDLERRDIYVSKNTDYTDVTFSSPRTPGEGALVTIDSTPVAFVTQEESVYISGVRNDWYQTKLTLSSDLANETLTIVKLKSGPGQGAIGQAAVGKIKNSVLYVTNDKNVDTLGRVENIDTPQSKPISDIVEDEFEGYDYTITPHVKYFKNKTYIAVPSSSRVMVFDHQKQLWYPPWILPARRFSIINDELYFHSSQVSETYKMFDGYNDDDNPIDAKAAFAYRSYGRRDWKKVYDEWFTEGYIASNTSLDYALKHDFGGFTGIQEHTISGADTDILFATTVDNSLGKSPIGSQPLGSITDSPSDLAKFRSVKEQTDRGLAFYEMQVVYGSNDLDQQWELLAFGGNVRLAAEDNQPIKS